LRQRLLKVPRYWFDTGKIVSIIQINSKEINMSKLLSTLIAAVFVSSISLAAVAAEGAPAAEPAAAPAKAEKKMVKKHTKKKAQIHKKK
jgi:hypothetical protein